MANETRNARRRSAIRSIQTQLEEGNVVREQTSAATLVPRNIQTQLEEGNVIREQSSAATLIRRVDEPAANAVARGAKQRGHQFWIVFLALCMAQAVVSLEVSAISTALPSIIHDLQGGSLFIWIGSAYTLCATAFVPLSGGLAEIFGRRPLMLLSLLLVCAGSAICGAAANMPVLIAGRAIQGFGGGGVTAATVIIVADMVSLRERGMFEGYLSISWGVFTCIGPLVAGALAQGGQWRWLFYLNIPFCVLTAGLILVFLKVPTPAGTWREKLRRIDWIGNVLLMGSSTATVIAVTWAGVVYVWTSWRILVPLVLGIIGIIGFFVYEAKLAPHPMVPLDLLATRTSLSGYVQIFIWNIALIIIIYYAPIYFEATKGSTPTRSGVLVLSIAVIVASFAVLAGVLAAKTGKYRLQMWIAWVLVVLGSGLTIIVGEETQLALFLFFLDLAGAGLGMHISLNELPILASLPPTRNAPALALATFARYFAQVWGTTAGGAVLQNALATRLSAALSTLPSNTTSAFGDSASAMQLSFIPLISGLPEPQRILVRAAFADSLREVWKVVVGVSTAGLVASAFMKELPLHLHTDEKWAMQDLGPLGKKPDAEDTIVSPTSVLSLQDTAVSPTSIISQGRTLSGSDGIAGHPLS